MKKQVFTGAGVAIVTPISSDGSINFTEFEKLIEFQIANSTDCIVVCGTTGEASAMSDAEHLQCIEFVYKKVNKRIPVVAGVGSNDTAHAINLTRKAAEIGVDGLLHVTPYYNKTNQTGLVQHFTACAKAVPSTPIILYNVPSRTGMSISAESYLELSKIENIVATKEASGNFSLIAKSISLCGENLAFYSGNDDQIVPLMSLGGIGVISVLANIMPLQTHNICKLYLDGEHKKSAELQLQLMELIDSIFIDVNPIPVKEALNIMGYNAGTCRLPLGELSPLHKAKLTEVLKSYKLA